MKKEHTILSTTYIIFYVIVSIANVILFVPDFWKKSKAEIYFDEVRTIFHIVFFFLTPNLNFITFILFLIDKLRKPSGKISKKNPELITLNILYKIHHLYKSELSFYGWDEENFQLETDCTDELRRDFGKMIELEKKLSILIIGLENTHSNSEITRLLLENEIMFTKIYTIIKESENINNSLTIELLLISQDSIDLFMSEFVQIKENEEKKNKEAEDATRKRLIDELQEEIRHQKNRLKIPWK
jgi:hypothetical protein